MPLCTLVHCASCYRAHSVTSSQRTLQSKEVWTSFALIRSMDRLCSHKAVEISVTAVGTAQCQWCILSL